MPAPDEIGVAALRAIERVVAHVADDAVVVGGTGDGVVAVVAVDVEVCDGVAGEVERVVDSRLGPDHVAAERGVAAVELLDADEIREMIGDVQRVIGPAADDPVVAAAAVVLVEPVGVAAGDQVEGVVAVTAVQRVVALAAADVVVRCGAGDGVVALGAVDHEGFDHDAGEIERVVACGGEDGVVAGLAVAAVDLLDIVQIGEIVEDVQGVVGPGAEDHIVAGVAEDLVEAIVAVHELEGVVVRRPDQGLVGGSAGYRRHNCLLRGSWHDRAIHAMRYMGSLPIISRAVILPGFENRLGGAKNLCSQCICSFLLILATKRLWQSVLVSRFPSS